MITSIRKRGLTLARPNRPESKKEKKEDGPKVAPSAINPFSTSLPPCIEDSIRYLEATGLKEEGIFRIPGVMSLVRELKTNYDRGVQVDLQTQGKGVHNVASLLKLYISELPDPVLTYELMDCFLMAVDVYEKQEDQGSSLTAILSCIRLLPPGHKLVLKALICFLAKVVQNSDKNCMSDKNIATCFAPAVVRRKETPSDMSAFLAESRKGETLFQILINNYHILFVSEKIEEASSKEKRSTLENERKAVLRAQFVEEIERGSRLLATSLIRKEAKKIKQFHTESDLSEFSAANSNDPSASPSPSTASKVSFNSPSSSPRASRVPPSPKPNLPGSHPPVQFRSDSLPIQSLSFSPQIPNAKPGGPRGGSGGIGRSGTGRRQPPLRRIMRENEKISEISEIKMAKEEEKANDVHLLANFLLQGNMEGANKLLQEKYSISTSSYHGDTRFNQPHGFGKLTFKSGDIYEGNFINGERTGKGKLTFKNGNVYEGDFVNGLRNGYGVFIDYKGNKYEGDFKNGKRTGFGVLTFASINHIYEGEFVNGVPNGFGKTQFSNGDIYEGEHKADERHGFGIFQGAQGGSFKGNYCNGKREGVGYFIGASGGYYKGQFKENSMHGFGRYVFDSGDIYIGQFVNSKFHGKGKYVFQSGACFTGNFIDGQTGEPEEIPDDWFQSELVKATQMDVPNYEFTLTFDDGRFLE